MKLDEIASNRRKGIKQYLVKIRLYSPGYVNIIDTVVYADTPQWARKIAQAQYNSKSVVVGQPKEIKRR